MSVRVLYGVISHARARLFAKATHVSLETHGIPPEARVFGYSGDDYRSFLSRYAHAYEQPVGIVKARLALYDRLRGVDNDAYYVILDDDVRAMQVAQSVVYRQGKARYTLVKPPPGSLHALVRFAISWLDANLPNWVLAAPITNPIPYKFDLAVRAPALLVGGFVLVRPVPARDAILAALAEPANADASFIDDFFLCLESQRLGALTASLRWWGVDSDKWSRVGGVAEERARGAHTRALAALLERYGGLASLDKSGFSLRMRTPANRYPLDSVWLEQLQRVLGASYVSGS